MKIDICKVTAEDITAKLAMPNPDHMCAGYALGKIENDRILIEDVYIPEQTSTKFDTRITREAEEKALAQIAKQGKKVVAFAQYNGNRATFETIFTKACREQLSVTYSIPNAALVVNSDGKYRIYADI